MDHMRTTMPSFILTLLVITKLWAYGPHWINLLLITESIKLIGEGKYNLNEIKEIKVTESFLGLDEDSKGCQMEEEVDNCTTRQHLEAFLACGCLPYSVRTQTNVSWDETFNQV